METELEEAVHEMCFCGNYLVQHAAVFNWSDDKTTQKYMLKELLRMADRVNAAAEVIRTEMAKKGN